MQNSSEEMTVHNCTLALVSGKDALTVRELAFELSAKSAPEFAWAEPDPRAAGTPGGSGRRHDFVPLRSGVPDWPDDLRLLEARLFWPGRSVHIIADGEHSLWAELKETAADNAGVPALKQGYPVRLMQDRARFGLSGEAEIHHGIRMIEYWNDGQLLGWRLASKAEVAP